MYSGSFNDPAAGGSPLTWYRDHLQYKYSPLLPDVLVGLQAALMRRADYHSNGSWHTHRQQASEQASVDFLSICRRRPLIKTTSVTCFSCFSESWGRQRRGWLIWVQEWTRCLKVRSGELCDPGGDSGLGWRRSSMLQGSTSDPHGWGWRERDWERRDQSHNFTSTQK